MSRINHSSRGRPKIDLALRLRTKFWYMEVKRRSGGQTDYALSKDFDPDKLVKGADRIQAFENIRRTSPILALPTQERKSFNLLEAVDQEYNGTLSLYKSPFWELLASPDLEISELQTKLVECTVLLNLGELKHFKNNEELFEPEYDLTVTAETFSGYLIEMCKGVSELYKLPLTGKNVDVSTNIETDLIANVLTLYAFFAALLKTFYYKGDLHRSLILHESLSVAANGPVLGSNAASTAALWIEVRHLLRERFLKLGNPQIQPRPFREVFNEKIKVHDWSYFDLLIDDLDTHKIEVLRYNHEGSFDDNNILINQRFEISEQYLKALQLLSLRRGEMIHKGTMNDLIHESINYFFSLSESKPQPSPKEADLKPFIVKMTNERKRKILECIAHWNSKSRERIDKSDLLNTALYEFIKYLHPDLLEIAPIDLGEL